MIIIIRGHIRNALDGPELYNLVHELSNQYPVSVYIHTWNVKRSELSWREMHADNTVVTEDTICDYFGDSRCLIRHIIIDDETTVPLMGNTRGNIGIGSCPLLAWKYYWYGKYKIMDYILKTVTRENGTGTAQPLQYSDPALNLRFDFFAVYGNGKEKGKTSCKTSITSTLDFIRSCPERTTINTFRRYDVFRGIDNIYMGNIDTMYDLANRFHTKLDSILAKPENVNVVYQEFLVYNETKTMAIAPQKKDGLLNPGLPKPNVAENEILLLALIANR